MVGVRDGEQQYGYGEGGEHEDSEAFGGGVEGWHFDVMGSAFRLWSSSCRGIFRSFVRASTTEGGNKDRWNLRSSEVDREEEEFVQKKMGKQKRWRD